MTTRYDDVLPSLRAAYDRGAAERDANAAYPSDWKQAERTVFLGRLRSEGRARLLEIGAGAGYDSVFFRDSGIEVVATDLSPEMVQRCRAKGLDAHVMDFMHLDFEPECFEAVYALNCLLHVPNADLPTVLETIRTLLVPGGLFFLGVYGGEEREGPADDDRHEPPRFFSMRTDEQIQDFARAQFHIVDFHVVNEGQDRFQSLTLRRPGLAEHATPARGSS